MMKKVNFSFSSADEWPQTSIGTAISNFPSPCLNAYSDGNYIVCIRMTIFVQNFSPCSNAGYIHLQLVFRSFCLPYLQHAGFTFVTVLMCCIITNKSNFSGSTCCISVHTLFNPVVYVDIPDRSLLNFIITLLLVL